MVGVPRLLTESYVFTLLAERRVIYRQAKCNILSIAKLIGLSPAICNIVVVITEVLGPAILKDKVCSIHVTFPCDNVVSNTTSGYGQSRWSGTASLPSYRQFFGPYLDYCCVRGKACRTFCDVERVCASYVSSCYIYSLIPIFPLAYGVFSGFTHPTLSAVDIQPTAGVACADRAVPFLPVCPVPRDSIDVVYFNVVAAIPYCDDPDRVGVTQHVHFVCSVTRAWLPVGRV